MVSSLVAFALLGSAAAQTVQLSVYFSSALGDYAVCTVSCNGLGANYTTDALWAGPNVSSVQTPGTEPLNLYLNIETGHHITTASTQGNAWALANGFTLIAPQGWVLAAATPEAIALEMWFSAKRGNYYLIGTPYDRDVAFNSGYAFQYIDSFTPRPPALWTQWPNQPQPTAPFPASTDLLGFEYDFNGNAVPPGVNADTWYPSWAADGRLYSSWTDGVVNGVHSASALRLHATTGMAIITGDDPFNLVVSNASTYVEPIWPYEGRYPSLNFMLNGTWFYGTYSVENYGANGFPSPPPDCGNWCILGPFCGIRTSTDEGQSWTPDPFRNMTGYANNIFGERANNNTKVKFGSPHAVDFGQENLHAPSSSLYIIGTGAEWADSHQSWMQGDSVYLARTIGPPDAMTINNASSWEFWGGNATQGWVSNVSAARPLLIWRQKTGVVTATYVPALMKYIICISTPTNGSSTVGNFDTYFLESDALTGPFSLVTYMSTFGPEAYFVNIPSKFMATAPVAGAPSAWVASPGAVNVPAIATQQEHSGAAYFNFFLSYSANFADQLGAANPPGSGYHWSLLRSRFALSSAFTEKLKIGASAGLPVRVEGRL